MRVVESPESSKRLRRMAWEHQRTFATPVDDLPRFVETILSAMPGVVGARAVVESVVFKPRYRLPALAARHALALEAIGRGCVVEADGAAEAGTLLEALLSEWADFFFVPSPRRLVIYADHDQYATFPSPRTGPISALAAKLTAAGFCEVEYVREF